MAHLICFYKSTGIKERNVFSELKDNNSLKLFIPCLQVSMCCVNIWVE